MTIIPHAPIVLSQIRVNDIWFLLGVGAVWELGCRLFLLSVKIKPSWLLKKEVELQQLNAVTAAKRKLGPQAFVETSKLERQVLALEKELSVVYEGRKKTTEQVEKQLLRYGNMQVSFLIFFLYYGVPMLTVESGRSLMGTVTEYEDGGSFWKRALFPMSYVGIGAKLSKWGMSSRHEADSSVGALVVMWSAQTTVSKLMDALDAYYL